MTRIFVLYGQGGYVTSAGMNGLAQSLKALCNTAVSVHSWTDTQHIVDELIKLPTATRVVLTGYSIGANAATRIAAAVKRKIDLLVAYDPTRQSELKAIGFNVGVAICYHNNATLFYGGARLVGAQVQTREISEFHLAVCYDQQLHRETIDAVKNVLASAR